MASQNYPLSASERRDIRRLLAHRRLAEHQRDLNDVPAVRAFAVALCAFEAGAILARRWPTLTHLSEKHPWLKPVLLAALFWHLYWQGKKTTAE